MSMYFPTHIFTHSHCIYNYMYFRYICHIYIYTYPRYPCELEARSENAGKCHQHLSLFNSKTLWFQQTCRQPLPFLCVCLSLSLSHSLSEFWIVLTLQNSKKIIRPSTGQTQLHRQTLCILKVSLLGSCFAVVKLTCLHSGTFKIIENCHKLG